MTKLQFYIVNPDYIDFLQSIDARVYNHRGDGYTKQRPYTGVILEVAGSKFFAPLTSYKPKQDKISPGNLSVFKIHERINPANKLGMISLKNMIPVLDSQIQLLDMNAQPPSYKKLLHKQYEFIGRNAPQITQRAEKLFDQVTTVKTPFYIEISCDFPKLIKASQNYPA